MPSVTILKTRYSFVFALILLSLTSCVHEYDERERRSDFSNVIGVNYIEVRRTFATGLSFHPGGYQLSPLWKITFLSNKFAMVYSPDKNRMLKFPVTRDHDSLVNVANTWLKPLLITKDSMYAQVLAVTAKKVYFDKSTVYMTLYSDNYIKNVLHKDIEELKKPNRRDTLFIQKRVAQVNTHPDSAFAGREPVVMTPISPLISVKKVKVEADMSNKFDASDDYMYPEFNISIKKAYKDFSYSIWATVDVQGGIHYQRSLNYIYPEFQKSTIETINAIINGYLKTYLQITPGKTLGMAHNSAVILNIIGKKG